MSIAWSLDGTRVASASRGIEGGELLVWNIQSGEQVRSFSEPSGIASAVAWGLSAELLVSAGGDGVLSWWDIQRNELLVRHEAHRGTIQSLRRSPDGTKLASCGDDGAIMLWDLRSGEHLQTIRRDRPYERLDITGIRGLTDAQIASLRALGAIENPGE
jgi:WD40 repeat protein